MHEQVLILKLIVTSSPRTNPRDRIQVTRVADKFWRIEARYGFMERPNVLAILGDCRTKGIEINRDEVIFYMVMKQSYHGRVGEVSRVGRRLSLLRWLATPFVYQMSSNCRTTKWWKSVARLRFKLAVTFYPTKPPINARRLSAVRFTPESRH